MMWPLALIPSSALFLQYSSFPKAGCDTMAGWAGRLPVIAACCWTLASPGLKMKFLVNYQGYTGLLFDFFQVTGGTLFQNIHIRAVHTLRICTIL